MDSVRAELAEVVALWEKPRTHALPPRDTEAFGPHAHFTYLYGLAGQSVDNCRALLAITATPGPRPATAAIARNCVEAAAQAVWINSEPYRVRVLVGDAALNRARALEALAAFDDCHLPFAKEARAESDAHKEAGTPGCPTTVQMAQAGPPMLLEYYRILSNVTHPGPISVGMHHVGGDGTVLLARPSWNLTEHMLDAALVATLTTLRVLDAADAAHPLRDELALRYFALSSLPGRRTTPA